MTTPRKRTTIILVSSTGTDGTLARPNDRRFSKSAEAKRKQILCGDLQMIHDLAMSESERYDDLADHADNTETYDKYSKRAEEELNTVIESGKDMDRIGC